jgi:transposase
MATEQLWEKRYLDLEKRYLDLETRYCVLEKRCADLIAENQALKEKLSTNSNNSSKPPSQDPFRNTRKRKSTGKKPGGQPGHPGHKRTLIPVDQVSEMVDLIPESCSSCGCADFDETPISIECRQVVELPVIEAAVTQYNIHTSRCCKCGQHCRPNIPKEAERGFGPRLMGFLTMLTGEAGVTKRKICAIAGHLGIKISLGALCNIHRLASEILEKPYEIIRNAVLSEGIVNADETSWRLRSKRCWLWIGATPKATFFGIDPSRSRQAYERIFGAFPNTLCSDRYSVYDAHTGKKQACLAHIDRDFNKMSERAGADGALGRILCGELDDIFRLWKKFKEGASSRQDLQDKAQVHIENIKDALTIAASSSGIQQKSAGLCRNLLKHFHTLWTFLYEEDVEPTNNRAERGLRPAVIWRKVSGGNQSDWGLTFTERLLTTCCTLKQQSVNVFEFLTKSFEARIRASPAPSPLGN